MPNPKEALTLPIITQYDKNGVKRTFYSYSEVGNWISKHTVVDTDNMRSVGYRIKKRIAQGEHEYLGYWWEINWTEEERQKFLIDMQERKRCQEQKYRKNHPEQWYDTCPHCNGIKLKESALCRKCSNKEKQADVSYIPVTRTELMKLIRHCSFSEIARTYNVSDNTIRKWCKKFKLPYRKTDIDSFSDSEWENSTSLMGC